MSGARKLPKHQLSSSHMICSRMLRFQVVGINYAQVVVLGRLRRVLVKGLGIKQKGYSRFPDTTLLEGKT